MKKILSLVLALAITLSLVSAASAVEIVGNNTQTTTASNEASWELCSWLTDENGYLCAQKYREADTVLALNETSNTIAGIVGNGKVQRAHNRHMVILDEYGQVVQGHGEAVWCKLELIELMNAYEQSEFDAFGIVTVEDLEDALSEAFFVTTTPEGDDIYGAYYRAVEINLSTTNENVDIVAKVYIGQQYFHVLLIDYDDDGDRELCLHLGLISSNSSTNNPSGVKPDEDKPSEEKPNEDKPGTDDESTTPEPGVEPNPENDTVILPWETDSSTDTNTDSSNPGSSNTTTSTPDTSTGTSTPNPGNDEVVLPF